MSLGPSTPIAVSDIDALQSELRAKPYTKARPDIVEQPWGTRDMTVTSPFGNRFAFTSALSS